MVSDIHVQYNYIGTGICLNPCSNGIWSLTYHHQYHQEIHLTVLILVLMEYGL